MGREGVLSKFFARRVEKPEKGLVATFLLLYSSITFTLCDGNNKVFFITFFPLQSFELAMHDSHPSLYSTKILYYMYISDPFW